MPITDLDPAQNAGALYFGEGHYVTPDDAAAGNDDNNDEINRVLGEDFKFLNLDKVFQVILKSASYEFLYKPNVSLKIIINEYLNASNFFLEDSQTKYLNALLDNLGKNLRKSNA